MPDRPYSKSPITEAVIELRFEQVINPDEAMRVAKRFRASYPHWEDVPEYGVHVHLPQQLGAEPRAVATNTVTSFKLTAPDAGEIVVVATDHISVSQLAPYPGWDHFFDRFTRDWRTFKEHAGYRRIQRIGVRFINRLDLPFIDGKIEQADYLTVYPQLPEQISTFLSYGMQVQIPSPHIAGMLTINTAVVPSFLLGHGAIMFDLDLSIDRDIPQNDDAIYDLLDRIRVEKNRMFELCITDRARDLFR